MKILRMTTLNLHYISLLLLIWGQIGGANRVCRPKRQCPSGYYAHKTGCEDIDECEEGRCTGINTECSNFPGGFTCECAAGYQYSDLSNMCKLKKCDSGWERFGIMCYKPELTAKRFNDSDADCRSQGAHLMSIHSLEEEIYFRLKVDQIMSLDGNVEVHNYWIGLVREKTQEEYSTWIVEQITLMLEWMDGQKYTGFPVIDSIPQISSGESPQLIDFCTGFYEGRFFMTLCGPSIMNSFICQKPKVGGCEVGWIEVDTFCYYNDPGDLKVLDEAKDNCEGRGGQLAKVETQQQVDAFTSNNFDGIIGLVLKTLTFDSVIARLGEVYHWTDGSSYSPDLLPWRYMEATSDENNMMMMAHDESGWYYDYGVHSSALRYFCKKPL